jgi:hypothetical protein
LDDSTLKTQPHGLLANSSITAKRRGASGLLDFFVNRVGVAVGAELFQFQTGSCIPAVFHRGVTGYTRSALIWVSSALGTFQRYDDPHTFVLSHRLNHWANLFKTQTTIIA